MPQHLTPAASADPYCEHGLTPSRCRKCIAKTPRPDLVRIPGERSSLARRGDPDTSHDAGNAQTADKIDARAEAILAALAAYGPMTDEAMFDRLAAMRWFDDTIPASTPQAFRTARARLTDAARVVDTGRRQPTSTGRTAAVWALGGVAA